MVTHGSVKGTKLLWISKAGFWFGLGTFWSSIHFSEECKKKKKKSKTVPLAMETLLQSTYMDDRIDSMVNEDEAVKLV